MANKGGTITIQELIQKEALEWGKPYELNVQKAIEKNQQFIASLKEMNTLYASMKGVKNETDLLATKEKEIILTKATTATYKEQQNTINEITRTKAQLLNAQNKEHKQLADLRVTKSVVNKLTKDEAVLNNALIGPYRKLNLEREQAKTKLRDLIASQTASNKQIKEAKLKYDELNTRILKADHATRDFTKNVGNYSSAFGKASFAVSQLAGAFGIVSALGVGAMIFNQVRELNALESALKKVTETSDGYIQAQTYIIDLARLTGVEYTKLTGSYTKFYASAKNTNLTLDQTQAIFAAVTKSSAVLGLSLDDTEGALRAVEQMLSKGNVQAEEIRGQLGERLPGAFQILAKSMGVTTIELNKMLKDGKVIAEEVLPKFAEELERTFGVDNNNKIETLNASIGRMKTEWTLFLKGIEGEQGVVSNFFKTFTDGISNIIKGFNDLNRVTSIVGAPKWYEILGTPIQTAEIMRQYNGIIQTLDTTYSKIEKMQYNDATIEFLSDYIYKIQLHMEEIDNLNEKKILQYQIDRIQAFVTRKYAESLEEVTKETDDNTKSTEENAKAKAKTAQKEEEAEKREKAHNIEIDKRNKLIEGSLGYFDKLISQLEAESKNLAVGSEEYKKVIALLEKYKKLKEELANITQNNGLEPMDESELQGQKTIAQIEAETRKRLADAEAQDLESFKDKWEQRVEIVQSALSEISNLINTVFQNRIDGIQAEMDANEDYYSHQMELAQDDSVQQNLLEEERFRKQEALRKKQLAEKQKQAKYEKAFNIMQIGLNTASAIVEALPNIPLSIYAGVIGALQLATAIATPIPKYKQGTQGHKGGLAIVGDGGVSEVIAEPNRKPYLSPNTDTLVNLERGTKVFPNIEAYKKYMSDLERASILTSFHNENERMKNTTQIFDFNLLNLQSEIKKGFKNVRVQNQNNIKVDLNFSYWKNKNINF